MMWAAGAVAAMSSITFPAVSALVSQSADPDKQGQSPLPHLLPPHPSPFLSSSLLFPLPLTSLLSPFLLSLLSLLRSIGQCVIMDFSDARLYYLTRAVESVHCQLNISADTIMSAAHDMSPVS